MGKTLKKYLYENGVIGLLNKDVISWVNNISPDMDSVFIESMASCASSQLKADTLTAAYKKFGQNNKPEPVTITEEVAAMETGKNGGTRSTQSVTSTYIPLHPRKLPLIQMPPSTENKPPANNGIKQKPVDMDEDDEDYSESWYDKLVMNSPVNPKILLIAVVLLIAAIIVSAVAIPKIFGSKEPAADTSNAPQSESLSSPNLEDVNSAPDTFSSDVSSNPESEASDSTTSSTTTKDGVQVITSENPPFEFALTVASVGLILINLGLFLEVFSRKEKFLLDWWVAPLTMVVLSKRDSLPETLWIIFTTICAVLMLWAIFDNDSEEDGKFGFIDLTSLVATSAMLLILHYAKWPTLPYPEYIPLWAVWMVFGLSEIRELSRSPLSSFVAIGAGILIAITLNPWIISIVTIVMVIIVTLSVKQNWTKAGVHQTKVGNLKILGNDVAIIVPWDILLGMFIAFTMVCFWIYGNHSFIQLFSR